MPQLNPSPWFLIFLLSWVTLLIVFKTKTLSLTPMTPPNLTKTTTQQTAPWNWPWT